MPRGYVHAKITNIHQRIIDAYDNSDNDVKSGVIEDQTVLYTSIKIPELLTLHCFNTTPELVVVIHQENTPRSKSNNLELAWSRGGFKGVLVGLRNGWRVVDNEEPAISTYIPNIIVDGVIGCHCVNIPDEASEPAGGYPITFKLKSM